METKSDVEKKKEEVLKQYYDKWLAIGKNTVPINHDELCDIIDKLYAELGIKGTPQKFFFSSPFSALKAAGELLKEDEKKGKKRTHSQVVNDLKIDIKEKLPSSLLEKVHFWYGQYNASWVGYYEYFRDTEDFKPPNKKLFELLIKLTKASHWFIPFEEVVLFSERPQYICYANNQLHADLKPAIRYSDGFSVFALNGVRAPEYLVMTPADELSSDILLKEQNVEIRKEIVRKIGINRVMRELKAQVVEEISGINLWASYPIKNYVQQGDVILRPENEKEIKFGDLDVDFVDRLRNVKYKLVNLNLDFNAADEEYRDGKFERTGLERETSNQASARRLSGNRGTIGFRPYLVMSNASHPNIEHVEGVLPDCKTVFEAICYRNGEKALPYLMS